MALLSLLCTGCESKAYYVEYNHGAKLVLSFFFLSLPLCLVSPCTCTLSLSLNELQSAVGVAATWTLFQEGGRLVAGSQRLNETADILLDRPCQTPPVDVFYTHKLYLSCGQRAHSAQCRGLWYLSPLMSSSVCVLGSISKSFFSCLSFGVEQGV